MARILVIDDDQQIQKLLLEILEQNGHLAVVCSTGIEGLQQYKERTFDLVILDVLLPDKSGFEVLEALKQYDDHVCILAISGGSVSSHDDLLETALSLGANKTLPKPFDLGDFVRVLNQMIVHHVSQ